MGGGPAVKSLLARLVPRQANLKWYALLTAALIVALIGVIWHLPLFLTDNIELPDVPLIFAGYVVYAWLFNSAQGKEA